MIYLESTLVHRIELNAMANIAIKFDEKFFQIRKHRYVVGIDPERYYPLHSLKNYVEETNTSNKQFTLAVIAPHDTNWAHTLYHMLDVILVVQPRINNEWYYSIWRNLYNPAMELRTYTMAYLDDLMYKYSHRSY